MKRKIISCTGYGGTGSSAITDLLQEFDNVLSLGDSEFWFLQGYDGVSDLEYYLLEGNHRSKVNLAVNRFKKYIKNHTNFYHQFFGENYRILSENYINNLIDSNFSKSVSTYEIENRILRYFLFSLSPKAQYIFYKLFSKKNEFSPKIPRTRKCYSIPDKKRFYVETKKYTKNLFASLDKKDQFEFIAFDQLVPSINITRYFNYIDDLKVIVVDRDPRDLFLLNQIKWNGAAYICDTADVHEFVSWYKTMRFHQKTELNDIRVLRIMFEDLIYKYENSLNNIYEFLGLTFENHIKKGMFFDPEISIKNTKLWNDKRASKYKDQINIIEQQLGEYCNR